MKMSEEDIRKELDKAAGNNLIEGHAITEAEKNLIYRIFEKYKGDYGSQAMDSLLYGLAVGVEDIKAEGGTRLMANVNSRFDEAMNKQSKYCYPNTDVLINKLGITDQEALDVAERRITTLMLMDLQTTPLPKPKTFFTPEYYFSLHKKIFEHIYSFAG